MVGTFWALVPPIIAIGLALITKEVYFSLLLGILAGGLFYTCLLYTSQPPLKGMVNNGELLEP